MDICARTRASARRARAVRSCPRRQLRAKCGEGLTAMAAPVLLRGRQFRRGRAELGQPKIRVVSKAARAARGIENEAFPDAFRTQGCGVPRTLDEHHRA